MISGVVNFNFLFFFSSKYTKENCYWRKKKKSQRIISLIFFSLFTTPPESGFHYYCSTLLLLSFEFEFYDFFPVKFHFFFNQFSENFCLELVKNQHYQFSNDRTFDDTCCYSWQNSIWLIQFVTKVTEFHYFFKKTLFWPILFTGFNEHSFFSSKKVQGYVLDQINQEYYWQNKKCLNFILQWKKIRIR